LAKRLLWIHVEFAGKVCHHKKEIADLFCNTSLVAGCAGIGNFCQLFSELFQDGLWMWPVKAK
jgi:hypothetical protein